MTRRPMLRHRSWDADGSLAAVVVLLLPMFGVLMGLVVDGGAAFTARQAAGVEAEQAARAGAGAVDMAQLRAGVVQVDMAQLRAGVVQVDPVAAVAAAERATVAAGHPGTASVAGGVVTVHVEYTVPTVILGMVGITSLHVRATASAVDVHGVAVGRP